MASHFFFRILVYFSCKNCNPWKRSPHSLLFDILNIRQIAADIEEILANQGDVFREWMSRIHFSLLFTFRRIYLSYLPFLYLAIDSWPRNVRTALEKEFRFQSNCKQLRIKGRNSMANFEIYFQIFSETMYTILKIFSQDDLRKCS